MVYLIICESNLTCKIGVSANPQERLNNLQTSNSEKLKLFSYIKGDYQKEAELHEKFSYLRKRGEWFELHEDILMEFGEDIMRKYFRKYIKDIVDSGGDTDQTKYINSKNASTFIDKCNTYKIPLGVHKGKIFKYVPHKYIKWICSSKFSPLNADGIELKAMARRYCDINRIEWTYDPIKQK